MNLHLQKNGKGSCPPWDGACEVGKPCSSKCKRFNRKLSNKARRNWNKKVIKENTLSQEYNL